MRGWRDGRLFLYHPYYLQDFLFHTDVMIVMEQLEHSVNSSLPSCVNSCGPPPPKKKQGRYSKSIRLSVQDRALRPAGLRTDPKLCFLLGLLQLTESQDEAPGATSAPHRGAEMPQCAAHPRGAPWKHRRAKLEAAGLRFRLRWRPLRVGPSRAGLEHGMLGDQGTHAYIEHLYLDFETTCP